MSSLTECVKLISMNNQATQNAGGPADKANNNLSDSQPVNQTVSEKSPAHNNVPADDATAQAVVHSVDLRSGKKHHSLAIVMIVFLLAIFMAGVLYLSIYGNSIGRSKIAPSSLSLTNSSTAQATSTKQQPAIGYETVVQEFLTALQTNDKATADSLQSPALNQYVKQISGGKQTSFDSYCQQIGSFCTLSFSKSFLAKGTKKSLPYTSASGIKGEEDIYTVITTASGANYSSNSVFTLTVAAIPHGNSWLIDKFSGNYSSSASGI